MPKNTWFAVLKPRHFLGLLFNLLITIETSLSVMVVKSYFLGKHWRINPLLFPLSPRSQNEYGARSKNQPWELWRFPDAWQTLCHCPRLKWTFWMKLAPEDTKAAFLGFTLAIRVRRERRSVIETSAGLWPRPMMVSSSQSPIWERVSTMAERLSIDTLSTNWPRWVVEL